MLVKAAENEKYAMTVEIIRQIALTGCRRSEMISLMWIEADTDASCMRLVDSKEGESIRPIGLPVVDFLEERRKTATGTYVFPGQGEDNAFGSFPKTARSPTSRRTSCVTALPASPTTSASPR
jgi:integrase